ncbi:MAG TPA: hypothetical protein DCR15_05680 [Arthrobacter bacterium]|nr:hypothetical protein [Arthrobacter sp.]
MARSRASAKSAGSTFERQIADILALHVDDRIDRKVKTGALDKGDIANLRVGGQKLTVEAKNYGGQIKAAEWAAEGAVERVNDGGLAWVVIAKRRGTTDPLRQWVLTEVGELIALINGNRAHMDVEEP